MNYKNEICRGCSQPIKDGDDIVVCPVCGTPQHRSCWVENARCVNSALHNDGFVWTKEQPDEPVEAVEKEEQQQPDSLIRQITSLEQLTMEAQNLESAFLRDQLKHKDEDIDGVSVNDAGYYLQSGAHRYIKRFRKGKKLSWNWGAFIFAPAWFFYRKLYKFGALFLALVVSINLFSYSFLEKIDIQMQEVYTVMEPMLTQDPAEVSEELIADEEFMTLYTTMMRNMFVYILITAAIPNTIAALVADKLVRKKMKEDIAVIDQTTDDTQLRRSMIITKGGVAPIIFAAVYFANRYLVSILISIGTAVAGLFN